MSRWPGKYVIGLTGNIATGKSVVRKMLEHLGAYGIDADALSHRSISKGAPGYAEVVRTFGEWILDEQGEVNRQALAKLVFSDSKLLDKLEAVVHPLVREALDLLVQRSRAPVVVIEAIKLLESGLVDMCDSVWVTHVPEWIQLVRLREKRGMSEQAARQRVAAQPPQQEKLARADVVIHNDESFESTWNQVQAAWGTVPRPAEAETQPRPRGEPAIRRGRPTDADEIASFINLVRRPSRLLNRADIMAAFGQKAYFLLELNGAIIGLIGWQVENLVTRADEVLPCLWSHPSRGCSSCCTPWNAPRPTCRARRPWSMPIARWPAARSGRRRGTRPPGWAASPFTPGKRRRANRSCPKRSSSSNVSAPTG
jgi:dephospho-CoA kinase